jgi:hypothetical protein
MVLQFVKRMLPVSVTTAALTLAALAVSPPLARSAAALHVTSVHCARDTSNQHTSHAISCEATWEGGTDPATASWEGFYASLQPGQTDPATHRAWTNGSCIPNDSLPGFPSSLYIVQVTITDATGQSVMAFTLGGCPPA